MALHSPSAQAQKLHAVLAVDTVSKNIANDMDYNLNNLSNHLRAGVPQKSLNLVRINGKDFTKTNVLNKIKSLVVNSDDSILFFYSGHGYYEDGVGTLFKPPTDNGANFYLSEIRDSMNSHGARLTVSIVDCCSVAPDGERTKKFALPGPPQNYSTLCQELFVKTSGDFAINSSAPREYALCGSAPNNKNAYHPGSLFTNALCDNMSANHKNQLSWKDLTLKVKSDVAKEFIRMKTQGVRLSDGRTLDFQETQTVWGNRNGEDWIPF